MMIINAKLNTAIGMKRPLTKDDLESCSNFAAFSESLKNKIY